MRGRWRSQPWATKFQKPHTYDDKHYTSEAANQYLQQLDTETKIQRMRRAFNHDNDSSHLENMVTQSDVTHCPNVKEQANR